MQTQFSNNFRGLWNRIKWFLSQEEVPLTKPEAEGKEEEDTKEYKIIFDGIGVMPNINLDGDIVATKKDFLEYMTDIGEHFRDAGEVDGTLEQKNYAVVDLIRTRVFQIQAYLASIFKAEENKADVDVQTKEEILKNATEEYESQHQYAKDLKKKYQKNYKEFSPTLGWIYLLAALFLVIADIPLAYKLTKDGFQLTEWWATPLMSLGLALSTLYIKVYYDEFVGSRAEESITRYQNLPIEGGKISQVKYSWWMRSVIKTSILGVSLATIIVLGFFRFQVYEPGLKALVGDDTNVEIYVNSVTKAAFILITLLFPLIGGVCASLGFDRLQNNVENKTIDKKCREKELKKLRASKDLEEAKKRKNMCTSYLRWCGKADESPVNGDLLSKTDNRDFVTDYTLYFVSCYTHGYERGMTINNLKKDVFVKANEFRKRMIAQKTANITREMTPEEIYEKLKTHTKYNA